MTNLVPDPLVPGGIANFGQRLRAGDVTAEAVTEAYLARIEALDEHIGAYQHVAADRAREVARAMDKLLAAGADFGPLMGVPVAIKDIIEVEGMPTTAGSRMETADLIGPEGGFVRRLKQAGCVILGKTKTVEFALGGSGTNWNFGTPRNPWDSKVHRVTAGSSSGSAAAMAAGMCGFAVGTDTGGSIRGPAAMCGVFGLKPTTGIWPADGLFAVSKTLDVIGPLTRSAADAAIVLGALTGQEAPRPARLKGLRIGRPVNFFFDDLDEHVSSCIDAAIGALAAEGVEVIEVDVPEIHENVPVFANISRPEIIAFIGRERFEAERNNINADVWDRGGAGSGGDGRRLRQEPVAPPRALRVVPPGNVRPGRLGRPQQAAGGAPLSGRDQRRGRTRAGRPDGGPDPARQRIRNVRLLDAGAGLRFRAAGRHATAVPGRRGPEAHVHRASRRGGGGFAADAEAERLRRRLKSTRPGRRQPRGQVMRSYMQWRRLLVCGRILGFHSPLSAACRHSG